MNENMAEPIDTYRITSHAAFEMERRGIDETVVRRVLATPGQRHTARPGRDVLQDRIRGQNLSGARVRGRGPAAGGGHHRVPNEQHREVLEDGTVKATYDARTDTLTILFKADSRVAESDENKPGVILDYDERGDLVSLEILDASKRVTEARRIEFETTG